MKEVAALLELLDIPPGEAIKALLSAFAPCQPGPIRQAWLHNKRYGGAPTTKEIWQLFEKADFRCHECGSQHRITLDHINGDTLDCRLENLQVLCMDHNRAKSSKGLHHKDTRLRIYRAIMELRHKLGRFPTDIEIRDEAGLDQLGGAIYLVRYLQARLDRVRPIRHFVKSGHAVAKHPNIQRT